MGRLNDTDRQPKNGSGRELAQNTFFFVIIPRCTNFVYKAYGKTYLDKFTKKKNLHLYVNKLQNRKPVLFFLFF